MTKVAFICVRNSCRSQIAEALGRHFAGDVFESCSAGTDIAAYIDKDAVRLMKKLYGIDMEKNQRPKRISGLPQTDIAVTMGCNVKCPNIACRKRQDWNIKDPAGKSDEEYIKTIKEIEKNILLLRDKIAFDK